MKDNLVNDTISRQAAINLFEKYGAEDDAITLLSSLPPTQPQQQNARVFQGIVVEYPFYYVYPEYKGKPYFSIKYTENGQEFIGYGTYKPEVLSEYLKEYFMPLAQPGWIPCSERMPDEKFECLVTIYRDNYFSGEHNVVFYEPVVWDGETWNDCFGVPMDDEVVAWMPWPKPWEGGQNGI